MTTVFSSLSKKFCNITDGSLDILERFVVLLYSKTSEAERVNEVRQELFARGRSVENIPPTQGALPHWYSKYIDQPFKQVIFGAKHLYPNNSFLLLLTGVGKKLRMDGCLDGLLYQKQAQLAVSCCTVVVKNPAKAYANVIRQN